MAVGIALSDDHLELSRVVRGVLARADVRKAARVALDGDGAVAPFWSELADLGWLGLHLPEECGGSGFGLLELAVVAEELGRDCAPGPFLPTVVISGAIAATGTADQRRTLLPGLASGATAAALGIGGALSLDGSNVLDGDAGPVLCAERADVLGLVAGEHLVVVDRDAPGLVVTQRRSIDPTRPTASVSCDGVVVSPERVIAGAAPVARHFLAVLAAAEAAGGAVACLEQATAYAKERTAFGRPIGQFQAVKHHCADMLIDAQLAVAAAWNASRAGIASGLALGAAAAVVALPAFLRCAKTNIQVHGGIGFTWEHDAHLHLRRAMALMATAGPDEASVAEVVGLGLDAPSGGLPVDLPPEAEQYREAARAFVAAYHDKPEAERHAFMVEAGYLFPHWPRPWGKDAGPVEQLVIDEELQGIARMAPLGATGWTLPINIPTFVAHCTDEQQQRWILPTMLGELTWCQLLSEPGAGSDLAALATRATRADAGWVVTGQKVWTSNAHQAQRGFAMVRTSTESKHGGITCMVVDMTAPGVTIRPLRQITGEAEFNEVFLDEVFVPDADVIGEVNHGWKVARTSLGNERVSLGEGSWAPGRSRKVLEDLVRASGDACHRREFADLVATAIAVRAMNGRAVARAVSGGDRGVEGSLTKLIRAEHSQRVSELGLRMLEADAVFTDGDAGALTRAFLGSRAATIAGGTSEIMRNLIAERALGLPREKE